MTTPSDPAATLEIIQLVLNSAEGQTPLGARLAPMIHRVQCAMTAKTIEGHMLSKENDELNKQVFTLASENDSLKHKFNAAHIQHCMRRAEWATDEENLQRKVRLLERKLKEATGQDPDAAKRRRTGGSDGAGAKP